MKHLTFIFLFLIILSGCSTQETSTPTPTLDDELANLIVVGDIDEDDPIAKIQQFQPIASYLAQNLSDQGITGSEVRIAPDIETMIDLIGSGEIDIYYDSLYPAMIVANATGAIPLVRGWRGGEPEYHSVFFALADSGIESIEDLNGRTIAYDNPASTSGYMMPTSYLLSNDLNPVEKETTNDPVAQNEIAYIFSGDDENTIEWVLSGRVDVGVVDNLTFLADVSQETRDNLVIIARTEDVPRRVVMIAPDIDPELANALADILIAMDETEEGQALLEIVRTLQFDEFPGGTELVFEPIREMFDVISDREQ